MLQGSYKGLQRVTKGYRGIKGFAEGTWGYKRLKKVTRG